MIDNELVQAIQQISEQLSQTSGWDIAAVIIGGISVFLTIVVLWYNHKSIELTQRSIRQAIDLQLFEKRLALYNAIEDDTAFYNAPLSLKIAYNEGIYILYREIVELCEKRWVKIWEFAQVFGAINLENREHGNICHELYEEYSKQIENELRVLKVGGSSQYTNDGKVFSLENHKANTDSLHKEICEKYTQLEEKMRTILNKLTD